MNFNIIRGFQKIKCPAVDESPSVLGFSQNIFDTVKQRGLLPK
jgi:hypothetical protein